MHRRVTHRLAKSIPARLLLERLEQLKRLDRGQAIGIEFLELLHHFVLLPMEQGHLNMAGLLYGRWG